MRRGRPRNIAASIRQCLLDLARERGEDFQALLIRFGVERLLYRLARSPHRDAFIVKGATLFAVWTGVPHRPTLDLDLLGYGDGSIARLESVFHEVCAIPAEEDGLAFDPASVRGSVIREDQEYEGVRLVLTASLDGARIPLQVDVAFGDAVVPAPREEAFPTILDLPPPTLRVYPREAVAAEKFQIMVALGIANSRMKDFYDVWLLARQFEFQGETLAEAIRATFERRRTPIPDADPLALTSTFAGDTGKARQWAAFVRKSRLQPAAPTLADAVALIRDFLLQPARAVLAGEPFPLVWRAGGPWERAGTASRR